ncbi:hypothetical protein O9929_11440 [Vibrio lentus]|nr:hypothetical protein [Vibrio lentus]
MAFLSTDPSDLKQLLDTSMQIGLMNYKVMEMLNKGRDRYLRCPATNNRECED